MPSMMECGMTNSHTYTECKLVKTTLKNSLKVSNKAKYMLIL